MPSDEQTRSAGLHHRGRSVLIMSPFWLRLVQRAMSHVLDSFDYATPYPTRRLRKRAALQSFRLVAENMPDALSLLHLSPATGRATRRMALQNAAAGGRRSAQKATLPQA